MKVALDLYQISLPRERISHSIRFWSDKWTRLCESCVVFRVFLFVCFCFHSSSSIICRRSPALTALHPDSVWLRLRSVGVPLHSAHMPTAWDEAERLKTARWKQIRKVMIYVCVRQMSQPLSSSIYSSLWQPGDNALIRLPADCREGGKRRQ